MKLESIRILGETERVNWKITLKRERKKYWNEFT